MVLQAAGFVHKAFMLENIHHKHITNFVYSPCKPSVHGDLLLFNIYQSDIKTPWDLSQYIEVPIENGRI